MDSILKRNTWEDSDLMNSFKTGDQSAFTHIFEKYYGSLCFFTNRLIADADDAEDIVQEVFYKLWHKHNDFNHPNELKSFLYVSCRNSALNYLKKEKAKGGQQQELLRITGESDDFVLNRIIYTESLREINTAMDALPEQCGLIIKMLFHEGLKPQEIAEQLDITVSTVYNQKMRGLGLLKKALSLRSFNLLLMILSNNIIN